jgi:ribosomal protein S8
MSSNQYNDLLKFLYFEGYADSYAKAEELLESMTDEEFEDLCEKHSFPLKPSERRSVENISRMNRGIFADDRPRLARKVEPETKEQPQPRKRKKLEFEVKEEIDDLSERKYDKDEPLPGSGKTPRQKMERKRAQHGARVMLGNPALGRHPRRDPESDSYRNRAHTIDTVKDAQDAGEEPSKSAAFKNTIAARRRPRASYEVPNERPGGLRAKATKAGGYRTLTRKEEFDAIVEYLFVEGYVDSYAEVEELEELLEAKDIPQEVALKLANALKGAPLLSKRAKIGRGLRQYAIERNRKRIEKLQQNEEFDVVVEYLFVEGFTDTVENAEVMAENISEGWVNEILNEMEVQPPREPLKTDRNMFTIPQKEKDAARERILAKAKAMREKKGIK